MVSLCIKPSFTNWRVIQHSDSAWYLGSLALVRLVDDLRRIVGKLEEQFKVLATYMTEIKMDELDKSPKSPKLHAFLILFGNV